MPIAPSNGIELFYDTFGDSSDVPLLLIMGLGAQMTAWPEEFCQAMADRGFYVIRFDNRDIGLSTKTNNPGFDAGAAILAALTGGDSGAPYLLSDMADDAAGLLDYLGVSRAHVIGASMGGMISQCLAIQHPDKVASLTSIMSTTGDPGVGMPDDDIVAALLQPPAEGREAAINQGVDTIRIISGEHFDEAEARAQTEAAYDRSYYPQGTGTQLVAIMSSPPRGEQLKALNVPTLVIHGEADRLVSPSGGIRTAEVIPGAQLIMLPTMAHDLPPVFWPQIIEAITAMVAAAPV